MEKIYVVNYLGENGRETVLRNSKTIDSAVKYAEELAASSVNYDGFKKDKFTKMKKKNICLILVLK
jgi:hypothetical protein